MKQTSIFNYWVLEFNKFGPSSAATDLQQSGALMEQTKRPHLKDKVFFIYAP